MNLRANPISRRGLLVAAAALVTGRRLRGQQQDPNFSAGVKVVNVFATVRNGKGEVVRDLTKADFTLEEDGRPQTIAYFSQENNLPLTLGLLVDTSGSQRRVLDQEIQKAPDIVRFGSQPSKRVLWCRLRRLLRRPVVYPE